jgi:hypothetical protein
VRILNSDPLPDPLPDPPPDPPLDPPPDPRGEILVPFSTASLPFMYRLMALELPAEGKTHNWSKEAIELGQTDLDLNLNVNRLRVASRTYLLWGRCTRNPSGWTMTLTPGRELT